jgi:predicted regulator of Ras-like GTPase activity (Roadblock/LC7/MglB family)
MEDQLREINAVLGVTGSFVCQPGSTLAAVAMPDQIDRASVENAARIVIQTLSALEVSGQRVVETDLVFGQGRLLVKNLSHCVLVVACARNINLPLLNLTANRVAKKIEAKLKSPTPAKTEQTREPEPPASEPKAEPVPASVVTPTPLFVELEQEMRGLIDIAWDSNIRLCALGPIAVWECCPRHRALLSQPRARQIDFLGHAEQSALVTRLFERKGFEANQRFNAFHGNRRLVFVNAARDLTAEVFLDAFEMYHRLDVKAVVENARVLPVTPLLLVHLQQYEMNDPVFFDLCVILLEHDLSVGLEKDKIDAAQITRLCADDWGWYKTVMLNLERVEKHAARVIKVGEQAVVLERVQRIKQSIEEAPKSLRWQTRARLGETVKWYETPVRPNTSVRPDMAFG